MELSYADLNIMFDEVVTKFYTYNLNVINKLVEPNKSFEAKMECLIKKLSKAILLKECKKEEITEIKLFVDDSFYKLMYPTIFEEKEEV